MREKMIPAMEEISNNGVSAVYRGADGFLYKRQPKFLTDNEIWCLKQMHPTGLVPFAEQVALEMIRVEYIKPELVQDIQTFLRQYDPTLSALRTVGIRHGDLTEYSVLVRFNRPVLIDFAESRLWDDPRTDKRPEGDAFWLRQTMEKLCALSC